MAAPSMPIYEMSQLQPESLVLTKFLSVLQGADTRDRTAPGGAIGHPQPDRLCCLVRFFRVPALFPCHSPVMGSVVETVPSQLH